MPTQSDSSRPGEWAARTDRPKRSVFDNYARGDRTCVGETLNSAAPVGLDVSGDPRSLASRLQASIDLAMARAFLYRFLAKAFEDPTPDGWAWLVEAGTQQSLKAAWCAVRPEGQGGRVNCPEFLAGEYDSFLNAYVSAFGHAARGSCPLNEIEYGDIKADPLFQPHRLADLAAFYRAFGLEVAEDAGERHDHLSIELEFLCVLAVKEAYAIENQVDAEDLAAYRHAQKMFLREHLGRWAPAFSRRLEAGADHALLRGLAGFFCGFVQIECSRFAVSPGSEDMMLRPVDEAADRMCDSCGIPKLPPGALATT